MYTTQNNEKERVMNEVRSISEVLIGKFDVLERHAIWIEVRNTLKEAQQHKIQSMEVEIAEKSAFVDVLKELNF